MERTAIFMMGGPAAGKTTVREKMFPGIYTIDCDAIKKCREDYDPKNAHLLHAWSTEVMTRNFFYILGTGDDFVYDGTGTSVERMVHWIGLAHEAGYRVKLVYVACRLETALERNKMRDRVVPENVVREKHARIATAFEIVARYADEITTIEND